MSTAVDDLVWEIRPPAIYARGGDFNLAPDWIEEIWWLRGYVLYDGGRRPQFRRADGSFSDVDPLDLYAYHVLGRFRGELVGCIRFVPTNLPVLSLTEQMLGGVRFERMLTRLGSPRQATADVGRWVVHQDYRRHRVALSLVGGCWSYLQELGFQTAIATVGTRAGQNSILKRAGLAPAPDIPPHVSIPFDDIFCTMYAVLGEPAPNFCGLVQKMGRRLVAASQMPAATWRKDSA